MEEAKLQAQRAHQLHQLKKEAIIYYQGNGVPLKMEDALNLMFKERPDCVYGYLANYFDRLAEPPVISGVSCHRSFDTRGAETLSTEVTCLHRNVERRLGRSQAVLQHTVYEHDKQEERDRELQELRQHVEAGVQLVNEGPLRELANQHFDPRQQREIDRFLLAQLRTEEDRVKSVLQRELDEAAAAAAASGATDGAEGSPQHQPEQKSKQQEKGGSAKKRGGKGKEVVIVPDEPREGFFPGCLALSCLSAACAVAGATAAGIPLYRHLRQQMQQQPQPKEEQQQPQSPQQSPQPPPSADEADKDSDSDNAENEWRLPLPMLTVLSGGKASPGKSNCVKEYMIVPKPGVPFDRVLRDATAVYQQVAKALSVKGGPAARFTNDAGSLNVAIDRPEAGFDLINDALKVLELTDSFDLAANIAGHELFDYEKGKYDLAQGAQKSPEEVADFLDDLSAKQPALIALIDPMRRVEQEAWIRLCQKASQRCLIIGDAALHRPGRLLQEFQEQEQESQKEPQPVDEEAEHQEQQPPQPEQQPQQQPLLTSGWVARLQQLNTVTELLDCAQRMQDCGNVVVAGVGPSDTSDTTVVDLAVAMGARYIKIGAPVRAERIDKLLRLAEIGEELRRCDQLSKWKKFRPPMLKPRGTENEEPQTQQQPPQQQQQPEKQPSASKSRKSSSSIAKA